MASKKYYEVDSKNKIIRAVIPKLSEKDKKAVKNYIDLGFELIEIEEPKKEANPAFKEEAVQKFLQEKGTKEQQEQYWKLYNDFQKDSKTGDYIYYTKNSKEGSKKPYKKGDKKVRGHIATLHWFKKTFPNYPNEK